MQAQGIPEVHFLNLQNAILCIDCELISYNATDRCLACGSRALMSVSRVLGGSLRHEQTARTIPEPSLRQAVVEALSETRFGPASVREPAPAPVFDWNAAMRGIVEQAFSCTQADGAAVALNRGDRIICTAQTGILAPPVGTEVNLHSGWTGLSIRSGRTLHCPDTEIDSRADARHCRSLGIQSLVAAPLVHLQVVLGVLEVLSTQPFAFDDKDVATVQLLANLMVLALVQSPGSGFHVRLPRHASERLCS